MRSCWLRCRQDQSYGVHPVARRCLTSRRMVHKTNKLLALYWHLRCVSTVTNDNGKNTYRLHALTSANKRIHVLVFCIFSHDLATCPAFVAAGLGENHVVPTWAI